MLSPFLEKKKSVEFRHPITNQVFLRTSFAEADKQMRRLTSLVDLQQQQQQQEEE